MTVRLVPTALSQKTLAAAVQIRPSPKWILDNKAAFLPHGEPMSYIGFKTNPAPPFQPCPRNVPSKKKALVAYLDGLNVSGLSLMRCLKQSSDLDEEEVLNLLATLSLQGFKDAEIQSMLGKYPALVRLKGSEVEERVQFYSGLGFNGNVINSLLVKRPYLLACDEAKVCGVIEFLASMGLRRDEDLSVVILKRPQILEKDVESLKSTVSSLTTIAKLSQADINGLLKKSPALFTSKCGPAVDESLAFWSSIGVEGKALCRALIRRPNLLNYDMGSMRNTYAYLQRWVDLSDVSKLASRFAELLAYDPCERIEPLISYLSSLGLSEKDIGKVILRRPQLMSYTTQKLDSTVRFLRNLGLKENVLRKILVMSPQVFSLNANDKLRRGVKFFQSIGIDNEREMEFLFSRNAQIFCCSIERNLKPTFDFFLSIGLEQSIVSKMVVLFPPMLGQNVQRSLAPKYRYLILDMNRSVEELVEFPQYFGYSLERRIKPRHKQLSERGVHVSLPSMLACTDEYFHKRHILPYSLMEGSTNADKSVKEPTALKKQETAMKKVPSSFMTTEDLSYSLILKPQERQARKSNAIEKAGKKEDQAIKHDEVSVKLPPLTLEMEDISCMEAKVRLEDNSVQRSIELDIVPFDKMHEEQAHCYPATFRKYYKKLSPCGMWIHAYKLEQ